MSNHKRDACGSGGIIGILAAAWFVLYKKRQAAGDVAGKTVLAG